MTVFLLWHEHELPGGEDDPKLIGVYSSREAAEAARERAAQLPGFKDVPDGFTIDGHEVDRDEWREGYVTARAGE